MAGEQGEQGLAPPGDDTDAGPLSARIDDRAATFDTYAMGQRGDKGEDKGDKGDKGEKGTKGTKGTHHRVYPAPQKWS